MQTTVEQLIQELSVFKADDIVYFSGLEFNRVKGREQDENGHEIVQIEFIESVYRNSEGNVVVHNHSQ